MGLAVCIQKMAVLHKDQIARTLFDQFPHDGNSQMGFAGPGVAQEKQDAHGISRISLTGFQVTTKIGWINHEILKRRMGIIRVNSQPFEMALRTMNELRLNG